MFKSTIYLGSWFPKTTIHLNELFEFFRTGAASDILDKKTITRLRAALKIKPEAVSLNPDNILYLKTKFKDLEFVYFEDGLLLLSSPSADFQRDRRALLKFYHDKLTPAIKYLYSKGAKGLEILREPGQPKHFFVTAQAQPRAAIKKYFQINQDEIIDIEQYQNFTVYHGQEIILINFAKNIEPKDHQPLLAYVVLIDEAKRHLQKMLRKHRVIWEASEQLLDSSETKIKRLPGNALQLTNYSTEIANILSRIKQMKLNFDLRQNHAANQANLRELLPTLMNISQSLKYMDNLFSMNNAHLRDNIEHLSNLYQNNTQNALYILQLISLTSVITGLLALGAMPGANLFFYDAAGASVARAELVSFDINSFIRFGGIAVLSTSFIYLIWNLVFKNIRINRKK